MNIMTAYSRRGDRFSSLGLKFWLAMVTQFLTLHTAVMMSY